MIPDADPATDPDLAKQPASLGTRSLRAAGWTVLQIGVSYGLRLGSNLILTRLLAPDAFGLVGLATTVIIAVSLLSDIGIGRSIIRETDGDQDSFLRAAWTIKILRSAAIAVVTLIAALVFGLVAPHLAPPGSTYADPTIPWIIAATAVMMLAAGFESTCVELASRRIDYRRIAMAQLGVQMIAQSVTIATALIYPTVWALVVGMAASTLASLIASHIAYPGPRMALQVDRDITRRLWVFGRWLILSSALTFVLRNADKLVLGALLSPTAFGLYAIAVIWVDAAAGVIASLIARIGYSALAEVAHSRRQDLPKVFHRLQHFVDLAVIAAFATVWLGADLLIGFLYSDTYADVSHYMTLLGFALFAVRFSPLDELLLTLGDSRAHAVTGTLRLAGLVSGQVIGWHLAGIDGLILASALHALTSVPFVLWKLQRHLPGMSFARDWIWLAAILTLAPLAAFL